MPLTALTTTEEDRQGDHAGHSQDHFCNFPPDHETKVSPKTAATAADRVRDGKVSKSTTAAVNAGTEPCPNTWSSLPPEFMGLRECVSVAIASPSSSSFQAVHRSFARSPPRPHPHHRQRHVRPRLTSAFGATDAKLGLSTAQASEEKSETAGDKAADAAPNERVFMRRRLPRTDNGKILKFKVSGAGVW